LAAERPQARKRIKLFAGIALDERVQHKLFAVAERLRERGLNARFESVEKYHLTLAFLGWVEPDRLDVLASALQTAADGHAGFDLAFDRIGAFPHERRPRVIWIGCRKQPAAYARIARAVQSVYAALSFAFKDDPVAHVTIARVKAATDALPTISAFSPIGARVSSLTLFESLPAGATTRYEVRAQAPLSAI